MSMIGLIDMLTNFIGADNNRCGDLKSLETHGTRYKKVEGEIPTRGKPCDGDEVDNHAILMCLREAAKMRSDSGYRS